MNEWDGVFKERSVGINKYMAFLPMIFYISNFCIGEVVWEGSWHWVTWGVQIRWRVSRVENVAWQDSLGFSYS